MSVEKAERQAKIARRITPHMRGAVATLPSTESLGYQAYTKLRRRLITLDLKPGDKFTEAQIVMELGIGKTPVREALTLLVDNGLIESRPRVGYVVTPITLKDVTELFDLRLVVEPEAVRLAAGRVDEVRLRRLETLCQGAYKHDDPDSIEDFLDANHEFHVTVAEASGNRRLARVVEAVLEESRRFTHLRLRLEPRAERFAHEHAGLLDALVKGDGDRAADLAKTQAAAAHQEVMAALLKRPLMSQPIDFQWAPPSSIPLRP
jgi:DNA-binding GntR family transcriptional regulator